ncbi:MAG: asparagine synthase (glutamine-hydrolyzing) [bacterium]|nr:asparagine synthase (glutamine-hydrolyzing) [bacterium]
MCGILGKITFSGHHESPESFTKALRLLEHRGPDDRGCLHATTAGEVRLTLAHTRLSILDISGAGHQPLISPRTGSTIVYNGEVYNFREIRDGLEKKGYSFSSECDTEVILAAYDAFGETAVQSLRGMFAFAIWDKERERLWLVRDRIGIKPLYYYWDGRQFAFASEVTALAALPSLQLEVSQDGIRQFLLNGYIPSPQSIFEGVRKLPPAHFLTLNLRNPEPRIQRYWSATEYYNSRDAFASREEALEALDVELSSAVEMRLISDVPLGAFLSGGIDSSLVVALMRRAHSGRLRTFSVGFSVPEWNEAPAAKRIAEHLGTEHEEFYLSEENILDAARVNSEHFDEPFADYSSIPTLALSRMTRDYVTVALSGDGGDELFWGYNSYVTKSMRLFPFLRHVPRPLRQAVGACMRLRQGSLLSDWGYRIGFSDFASFFVRPHSWLPGHYSKLHRHNGDSNRLLEIGREATAQLPQNEIDLLGGVIDLHGYLVDDILTKVDRSSMAVSLEARVPILDHRVVELAARIPIAYKTAGREQKHFAKALLEKYLPRHLWDRPKMGFSVPMAQWIRGPLKEWVCDELRSDDTHLHDWLDRNELNAMLDDHLSGRRNVRTLIWACLQLAGWDRRISRIRSAGCS